MADGLNLQHTAHRALLDTITAQGRYRRLSGRSGVDFSSNDYLGLSIAPRMQAAITDALARGVPVGAGGSRLLRGNHAEHDALESEAATFFGAQSALYFSTGFAANAALFASMPQRGDLIVFDELIHASVHEGMRLGRAETQAAVHNDVESFATVIRDWRALGNRGRVWIVVETLYSMDGDTAPLPDLAALADANDAFLVIDEAHATGVFGPDGRGFGAHLVGRDNVIALYTCGKALGVEGALLCGPAIVREFLINYGRGFIFSTAPSPLMASAVREALRILADEPERRDALALLVADARARLGRFSNSTGATQIIPVILGDDARAMAAAAAVQAAGYDVRGIRPPTVPAGTARLRVSITLNASHEDIAGLADAIAAAIA
ncbi:MAG: 8-amino-7-oxononanoate synthase [Sphingorhabdus sp.]